MSKKKVKPHDKCNFHKMVPSNAGALYHVVVVVVADVVVTVVLQQWEGIMFHLIQIRRVSGCQPLQVSSR